jgi:sulfide:quinone oxidoreductase
VTIAGEELPYDALLVATGAMAKPTVSHALTFSGPGEMETMHGLIQDLEGGHIRSVAFFAPPRASWTLPLYELALQTAERARDMCLTDVAVSIVSHEEQPLAIFGDGAVDVVGSMLAERGIAFVTSHERPEADRVVALPVLAGCRIDGLPATADGFVPVDGRGRAIGLDRVWAAGDGTDFAIKQGGLASQQAGAAADAIAAVAGYDTEDTPFEPVLRAMLIVGRTAWYLRRRLDGVDPGLVSSRAMWWPPTKIAGRYLGPFLDRIDADGLAPQVERTIERATAARDRITRA